MITNLVMPMDRAASSRAFACISMVRKFLKQQVPSPEVISAWVNMTAGRPCFWASPHAISEARSPTGPMMPTMASSRTSSSMIAGMESSLAP